MSRDCVLILGGSFDPVHLGHVGLAHYFCTLLHPDQLRLIPTGQAWQKAPLLATAQDRVAMLKLAFADWPFAVQIDPQEIDRAGPSYAIDTLRALRADLGEQTSLIMALGADQIQNLHTWHQWEKLFELAHLCFVTRPGSSLASEDLHPEVAQQLNRRLASAQQIRETPAGLAYAGNNLALQVSSTAIRQSLTEGSNGAGQLPAAVLDYIQQHHLYQTD